jgi:hypothetical protein
MNICSRMDESNSVLYWPNDAASSRTAEEFYGPPYYDKDPFIRVKYFVGYGHVQISVTNDRK